MNRAFFSSPRPFALGWAVVTLALWGGCSPPSSKSGAGREGGAGPNDDGGARDGQGAGGSGSGGRGGGAGGGGPGGGAGGLGGGGGSGSGGRDGGAVGPDAPVGCAQGERVCDGSNDIRTCEGGVPSGPVIETCGGNDTCSNGRCVSFACASAAARKSYLGCDYWPVDLDNAIDLSGQEATGGQCPAPMNPTDPAQKAITMPVCIRNFLGFPLIAGPCEYGGDCTALGPDAKCETRTVCGFDGQHAPYAVAVSNPDTANPAQVKLTNAAGMTHAVTVPPRSIVPIFPQTSGFADQSLNFSGIEPKAYRLTSDRPVAAYQFNPLDNVGVFTNDASLLLPSHTFDRNYYALIHPGIYQDAAGFVKGFKGYVTVVASATGTTNIKVTATAAVLAGKDVPAIPAGGTATFALKQYDTLNLEAAKDGDLTGSVISGDRAFGMYVGHEAQVLAESQNNVCCADHMEESLFPASTWGKAYAVAKASTSSLRSGSVKDLVRVMAQESGTTVTFNPATGSCPMLDPGKFCDVWIGGDVEVSANKPILVAHYLASITRDGATNTNNGPSGDPDISFAVPTEQYRTEYTVLVPDKYLENYASIVVPAMGTAVLDGTDVSGMAASFGSGALRALRIPLSPGQHNLTCSKGCGIEVYGWAGHVSYMYPGGLDLKCINPGGTAQGTCD